MFFNLTSISHFHSFDFHLRSQLRSLWQKCDPGGCDPNSNKSRLCFFSKQTFSIFIALAVAWGPNLDPCSKNVILAGAIKIHIKVASDFLPIRHFPFSFLWLSLEVPTWFLPAEV